MGLISIWWVLGNLRFKWVEEEKVLFFIEIRFVGEYIGFWWGFILGLVELIVREKEMKGKY